MFDEQFWLNVPKMFCQDASVNFLMGAGSSVVIAMLSGANAQAFVMTPEHAKRFSQSLAYSLEQFEKTNGKINVEDWVPGMKSPIQIPDIKGGAEGSGQEKGK